MAVAHGGTLRRGTALDAVSLDCDALSDFEPRAVGFTYWFDPPERGQPFPVQVRFVGRRVGVTGKPGRHDRFEVVERIDRVVPGSGPVALTVHVADVAPGEWHVTATPDAAARGSRSRAGRPPVHLTTASSSARSAYAPVVRVKAPGARLFAWPSLVAVGVVVALVTQALLARGRDLPVDRVLVVSLLASIAGLAAAKFYYLVEHRGRRQPVLTAGLCIQGFVLGAVAVLIGGALLSELPVGRVLDVTTPGLLFAMTVGRFGCFFGGCCAGRPTSSRWGVWSSDRRIGVRRLPTQLFESAIAFTVGVAALVAVTSFDGWPGGAVFVAAIAAYTFGRQLLFPLRDLPRHTSNGRLMTMALAGAAFMVAIVVAVAG
jgi:phosphatidylglycerol:prolipoprotein diacylglycerol transferase